MVYSPIPYTDEHVKTINCNTYSATVLDTLSKNNLIKADNQQTIDQFEEFFNPRFSFGRRSGTGQASLGIRQNRPAERAELLGKRSSPRQRLRQELILFG